LRRFREPDSVQQQTQGCAGGIAAMEVLARDLKSLGLYAARSLSYAGVEVEIVEYTPSPEQVRIYDACAEAFQIIHNNLTAALAATNITSSCSDGGTRTYNAQHQARSAGALRLLERKAEG
jgi:P-loop containing NTP hydrolase pore-1